MTRFSRLVGPMVLSIFTATTAFAEGDLAVEAQIFDDVATCDQDGVLDVEEVGRLVVVVRNQTERGFEGAVVHVKPQDGLAMKWHHVKLGKVLPFGVAVAEFEVEVDFEQMDTAELRVVVEVAPEDGIESAHSSHEFMVNMDAAVGVSNVDDVEYAASAWQSRYDSRYGVGSGWARGMDEHGNAVWFVVGSSGGANASLESPVFRPVHGEDFVLSFDHRYEFNYDDGEQPVAAGVIELSSDGGLSWQDISQHVEVPYDGKLEAQQNDLEGRVGFVSRNPSLPGRDRVELNLGTTFQGDSIQIRFRMAASPGQRAAGWELDDFEVRGSYNEPFNDIVEHRAKCIPQGQLSGKPFVQLYLPDDPQGDANGFLAESKPLVFDAVPEAPGVVEVERPTSADVETVTMVERASPYNAQVRKSSFGLADGAQVAAAAGCTTNATAPGSMPFAMALVMVGWGFMSRRRR